MYPKLAEFVSQLQVASLSSARKDVLSPLITYIQDQVRECEEVRLNFICTHNSRRSHLCQIWAQTMAAFYRLNKVACYSGGTEATAVYPMVLETLKKTGFGLSQLSQAPNPVYAIKFDDNEPPIIGFSKAYDNAFNPQSAFAAIMTCSQADAGCPFVVGATRRIAITYEDPKVYDNTSKKMAKYEERSVEIATEMKYVFSRITI